MKILVIEDEEKIASFIKKTLEAEKNEVTISSSIEEVWEGGMHNFHDLIVLDLMLPGKSGLDLVKKLKQEKNNVPVLVASALNQISSKIDLLNAGADDYITKPFDANELSLRIRNVYRRYLESKPADKIKFQDMTFYRKENKVVRGIKEINLTSKEADVLLYLLQNKGQIVRTEDILQKIWNTKMGYHSNILQATILRLRKKVDGGFIKKYITTYHGVGYGVKA